MKNRTPLTENKKTTEVWMIHPYGVTREYPASTRTYEFASELASRGYNVTCWFSSFIHPLKRYKEGCQGRLLVSERIGSFNINWLWASSYHSNNSRRSVNMLSFFLTMLISGLFSKTPDVIIGSSPHLFGALAGLFLSKIKKARFILEIRDLWPDSLVAMNGISNGPALRLLYMVERYLYRASDHIIVLTEGIRENLIDRGIPARKISFIPNGVSLDMENESPGMRVTRNELGLEDKFVCMYAGAVAPANALETILMAAKQLSSEKGIVFVIIGEGQEKVKLEQMAGNLGIDNILFLGAIPKKHMNSYLMLADVFLLTLKGNKVFSGALPNKIFDYLFNNKPVICAVDGEARKFVEETETGLYVPPEDVDGMVSRILDLYTNHDLRERLSGKGRRIVEEQYSRETLCNRLDEIICNALDL